MFLTFSCFSLLLAARGNTNFHRMRISKGELTMKKQKGLALVLAALMLLSCVGAAAEEAAGSLMGSKKAAPTELTEDNRETTVTLSLPSEEYKNKVDIVFAMDSSTSAENSAVFMDSVTSLFNSIKENNPDVELRIGIIRFRGRAHDAVDYLSGSSSSGLTLYSDDTKSYIEQALSMSEADIKAAFGNGSNTHGGIDIANEWLKADNEVDDDHKYLVLLTDGKTYIWNDENHEPTTIYSQWFRSNSYAMQPAGANAGKPALNQSVGYNKYAYPVDVLDPTGNSNIFVYKTMEKLLASDSAELTGVSKWDVPAKYADDKNAVPSGTVVKHNVTNGAALFGSTSATYGKKGDLQYYYEFTPNSDWEGVPYLKANPFMVIENSDGTYTFDTDTINPEYYLYHVDPLQKGIYKAAKLWEEVNAKYNCAVITYDGGSNDSALSTIRPAFNEWLRENSKYGAKIDNASQVEEMFKGIDNSINYLVNKGTVTDQIKDDFTLKESDAPFTVTVSGKALAVTKTGDSSWVFGDSLPVEEGTVYPYEISYDAATKTITWTINVPVEIANPVTLSYDLVLREDAESGTYDTNEYAILDYESTDGEKGTFTFPIPQVTYTKPEPTVKPTATPKPVPPANEFRMFFYKEWPDGEPTDIFFTLYQPNGSVYKHAFKKTKVSDTKFLYEAWLSNDAEYFVIETAMAGYNTAYKNTGAHADVTDRCFKGGTIINTKIPVTGDSMTSLWVLLALVSAGAIALLARKKT